MTEFTYPAVREALEQVLGYLDGELEARDCPMKIACQLDVAVEELFVNVCSYAYPGTTGDVTLRFDFGTDDVSITFLDRGIPYDPLSRKDPDVTLPVEDRSIGGLGIFIVKKTMDAVRYQHADGQNQLTIYKKLA